MYNRRTRCRRARVIHSPQEFVDPEAVTDDISLRERNDSRDAITMLSEAVATLSRQMDEMRLAVAGLNCKDTAPEEIATGTLKSAKHPVPAQPSIVDVSWFAEPTGASGDYGIQLAAPNPWMHHVASAANIDCFDGDPRNWPTFIANFRSLVHDAVPSDTQRLAILSRLLSPKLRSAFAGLLANPLMYREVLQRLQSLYGDKKILTKMNLADLMALPPLKSERSSDLETFFCKVSGAVSTMRLCGLDHDLQSVALVEHTATRLTPRLYERWLAFETGLPGEATLETLVNWLQRIVAEKLLIASAPVTTASKTPASRSNTKWPVVLATVLPEVKESSSCVACCSTEHNVGRCPTFLSMTLTDRMVVVRQKGLCLRCLRKGHRQRDCSLRRQLCREDNCTLAHHPLLHGAPRLRTRSPDDRLEQEFETVVGSTETVGLNANVLCAVVPVVLRGANGVVKSFALLDSGSEVSLISQRLAGELKLGGPRLRTRIRTMTGEASIASKRASLDIESVDGKRRFSLQRALVVPNLHFGTRMVSLKDVKARWTHLAEIAFPTTHLDRVEMLIGMDVPLAHQYSEVRVGPNHQLDPVGVNTPFGWTVVGQVHGVLGQAQRTGQPWVGRQAVVAEDPLQLDNLIRRFLDFEPLQSATASKKTTADERIAIDTLESTTRFTGRRYEVGLLWKSQEVTLPCNRDQVIQRFYANERRLLKDGELAGRYDEVIQQYIRDGHAKKLCAEDDGSPDRMWYLPHHAVWNSQRSKIRVVFDASATYQGVSLNQCLLKGPDLLPNLYGVLLRFRHKRIPVSADVERMYHQVLVKKEDRSALRFLWRRPGDKRPPGTFEMQVHVFGATSSPCVCMFAMRRAAIDNGDAYPDALGRIQNNVYVDNWLESFDTAEQAAEACEQMNVMLAKAGFHLRKWTTTIPEVLKTIDPKDHSDVMVDRPLCRASFESALGLRWDCREDVIQFHLDASVVVNPTKRQMLSLVARLFDPLGLLSPVTITARILLQDLWRSQCGWDEVPHDDQLVKRWRMWSYHLEEVDEVRFRRCLSPCRGSSSIHLFSDASSDAYGAVAYLRTVREDGEVSVVLAFAKARVAPIRRISIPRLELLGAVTAARAARLLCQELCIPPESCYFWTDSCVVLWWLKALKRFPVFVENRTTEILDGFRTCQWRHVPGSINPADDLSRGLRPTEITEDHRWIAGPNFLRRPPEEWPNETELKIDDAEACAVETVHAAALHEDDDDVVLQTIKRMSNLDRVLNTLARARRFLPRGRRSSESDHSETITVEERSWAWRLCVRAVQRCCFAKELRCLRTNETVLKKCRLRRLAPFVDADGLLRVGGRLVYASLDADAKHPVILPGGNEALTTLYVRQTHEQHCHAGIETTLALIRANVWVVDGRAAVRRVVNRCVRCRRYLRNASCPVMAPLPPFRVVRPAVPFSHVGTDFCGPFLVSCRRTVVKRWLCLFTCLATRAVHLEVCFSLDTDSFLNAFRRFAARRGMPSECYSDNGTNFVAAAHVLNCEETFNNERRVSTFMANRKVVWHFNPPAAPHFGGSWERLIRSVKSALRITLHSQRITDEVLSTVAMEIESMTNNRPLTYVSGDPVDEEPVTPNHFLLGRPFSYIPIDVVKLVNVASRRQWQLSQLLLDKFWMRWMKQYVPTLMPKTKDATTAVPVRCGDVVLVVDPAVPRGQWMTGKIVATFPGQDGIVRVVDVKTKNGVKRRPVVKILPLLSVSTFETVGGDVVADGDKDDLTD